MRTPVALDYAPNGWRFWSEDKRQAAIKAARLEHPGAICFRVPKGLRVVIALAAPTIGEVVRATARLEAACDYATTDYSDGYINATHYTEEGLTHAQA